MSSTLTHLRFVLLCALGACAGDSVCTGSTPIRLGDGSASGYETCSDGAIHRAAALPAPVAIDVTRCEGSDPWAECSMDADCTAQANGACMNDRRHLDEDTTCGCVYSCGSDADCGEDSVCVANGVVRTDTAWSTCVPATCVSDADCPSGECGIVSFHDGCILDIHQACRDEGVDRCRTDDDCAGTFERSCAYHNNRFYCEEAACDPGRPLLVEQVARTAPLCENAGWWRDTAGSDPEDPDIRRHLADRWARLAAMEHASVASFARFTLQLLALGAPADLLADTQRAAADEVEHARLAYGLASRFSGRRLGPGPLDLTGAAPSFDPQSVLMGLVDEACVGETLGAAEAAEAALWCEDSTTKAVLERIAADEARHAALAWRSLRWLLQAHPALRPLARSRLQAAVDARTGAHRGGDDGLRAYGLLGGPSLSRLREATARGVVAPCITAALAA